MLLMLLMEVWILLNSEIYYVIIRIRTDSLVISDLFNFIWSIG